MNTYEPTKEEKEQITHLRKRFIEYEKRKEELKGKGFCICWMCLMGEFKTN